MQSLKQMEALRIVASGAFYPDFIREEDGWHARWRAVEGVDNPWVDEYVRAASLTVLSEDAEDQAYPTLHDAWIWALRSRTGLVRWEEKECGQFAAELARWHGSCVRDKEVRRTLVFTFQALPHPAGEQAFAITCPVPKSREALRALGQAAAAFSPLVGLRRQGRKSLLRVLLSPSEAENFLHVGAPQLRQAGYSVVACDLSATVSAQMELSDATISPPSAIPPERVAAKVRIRVDGQEVGREELRFLLDQGSTFVFFRDHWLEVDRALLREALRVLEKNESQTLTRGEAIRFACGLGHLGRLELERVRAHGWLRGLLNELGAEARFRFNQVEIPSSFCGTLRAYQKRGFAWLWFLTAHGFGALLADDMGLGKTIQTIAWICTLCAMPRTSEEGPVLIVAPLTLLANWRHEFAKFAPTLTVYVHQGEGRQVASLFRQTVRVSDVVVTSYTLLVRDYAMLVKIPWRGLVLDEAQAIKNPATQVARAVCALGAPRRIALSGTPIENSVADIWSLESFLNPGFLGDRATFTARFVRPIATSGSTCVAAKRLRRALEPFLLRREKSDPAIASELGPKREVKEYCELSARQRAEYEIALADWRVSAHRRGDVFALLTRLKLICDGTPAEQMENGKQRRLIELLEELFALGESALIFTQYARVGAALRKLLHSHFGVSFPFLHGGLSVKGREREIAAFEAPGARAFILSLKAGGFGLNLTKATHVIHFDRWWNPAVENQATDRAHRIGQAETVLVHTLIAAGTVEEHVDEILMRKSEVAGSLVAGGEAFLLKMSASELERTVALDE